MTTTLRKRAHSEEGVVTVVFLGVATVLMIIAGLLVHLAGNADAGAGAQTAADAAVLAATDHHRDGLRDGLVATGADGAVRADDAGARAAAADYARRNGAVLVDYERDGLRITVTVRAAPQVATSGFAGIAARPAEATASAVVQRSYDAAGGGGGPALTPANAARLARQAGVDLRSDSALLRYGADCAVGVDVAHLSYAMKAAVLKLEHAMQSGLVLASAYRDHACQARLFATLPGPVAPPGKSMHNVGAAIDVAEPALVAPHARAAGLCQPFPENDAVHFALASSPECAGVRGPLDPGAAYGGDPAEFVTYHVRLVEADAQTP